MINFEKFFEKNIDFVAEEMRNNLPILFAHELSLDNTEQILKVYDYINSLNNRKILDTFIKYSDLKYEDTLYQNCLAYYLGFKKGIKYKSKQ